jgi:hypothetical protein
MWNTFQVIPGQKELPDVYQSFGEGVQRNVLDGIVVQAPGMD